jgi:hypothetical protein
VSPFFVGNDIIWIAKQFVYENLAGPIYFLA